MVPLCKLHLVAASHSYTCAQDGLVTAQLALVVLFIGALVHLLMCAQTDRHTLQLALCGGGIYIYIYTLTTRIYTLEGAHLRSPNNIQLPPPHSTITYNHHIQAPADSASYTSAIGVFVPLAGRKAPPAQDAEGQGDRALASIGARWSGMQQEHATCTWVQLVSAHMQVACSCKLHCSTVHFMLCSMEKQK